MSAKENKAIFLRFLDELRKGNLGVVDEVCSLNFAFYSPNWPNWPRGLEGARKLVAPPAAGPVETRFKVEDIFAGDDKVAVRWTFRGTYREKPGRASQNRARNMRWARSAFIDSSMARSKKTGAPRRSVRQTLRGAESPDRTWGCDRTDLEFDS